MHVALRSGASHKIINRVLRSGAEITVIHKFVLVSFSSFDLFLFRFLRNKTNAFWLQGELFPSGVKWPIEIAFVIENVIKQPRARKANS